MASWRDKKLELAVFGSPAPAFKPAREADHTD